MVYKICSVALLVVGFSLAIWSLVRFLYTDNFVLVLFCVGAVVFFGMAILGALSRQSR